MYEPPVRTGLGVLVILINLRGESKNSKSKLNTLLLLVLYLLLLCLPLGPRFIQGSIVTQRHPDQYGECSRQRRMCTRERARALESALPNPSAPFSTSMYETAMTFCTATGNLLAALALK